MSEPSPALVYPLRIRNVWPGPLSEWGLALVMGLSVLVFYGVVGVALYITAEWKLSSTLLILVSVVGYLGMIVMIGGALYLLGTRRIVLYDGAILCAPWWRCPVSKVNGIVLLADPAADYADNTIAERIWLVRIQWLRVFRHRLYVGDGDTQQLVAWATACKVPIRDQRENRDA